MLFIYCIIKYLYLSCQIVKAQRKTDLDTLAKLIARESTVSRTDVYSVLLALLDTIVLELSEGRSVDLIKLGSFGITVKSNGELTADLVTGHMVKGAKVVYRPGKEVRTMIQNLQFEKES